jgi:hypothetical protein
VFSLVAHKQLKEKKSEAIKGTCTVNYMADGIQAMEKKKEPYVLDNGHASRPISIVGLSWRS